MLNTVYVYGRVPPPPHKFEQATTLICTIIRRDKDVDISRQTDILLYQ